MGKHLRTILSALLLTVPGLAWAEHIIIGVLSHRGDLHTLNTWSPTADYLTERIPEYDFLILPLKFEEIDTAVEDGDVDFILVNPGIYVSLEFHHRVSRIATLNNRLGNIPYNVFGGVIFTRDDRDDLKTLSDLRGKRFMAVNEASLGGFQMAWSELRSAGLDPYRDFSELSFAGIHDEVVMAVRDGMADAGTVRSNILERLQLEGSIELEEFRVINPRSEPGFPLSLSTGPTVGATQGPGLM